MVYFVEDPDLVVVNAIIADFSNSIQFNDSTSVYATATTQYSMLRSNQYLLGGFVDFLTRVNNMVFGETVHHLDLVEVD